jgi:hypothetical protein
MYTINTQLAYFKYSLNPKKIIVNITWYKLEKPSGLSLQGLSFNGGDLNSFKAFMDKNRLNFPGCSFVEQTDREGFYLPPAKDLSHNGLPLYLILSHINLMLGMIWISML